MQNNTSESRKPTSQDTADQIQQGLATYQSGGGEILGKDKYDVSYFDSKNADYFDMKTVLEQRQKNKEIFFTKIGVSVLVSILFIWVGRRVYMYFKNKNYTSKGFKIEVKISKVE